MTVAKGLQMYAKTQARDEQSRLIEQHAPLVRRIAYHMLARLPNTVQVDDLIQAGMIGLLEAAKKYDVSKGASFETFVGIRIRGAMLDEMRRGDWVPRSVHRNSRLVGEAVRKVEAKTGRDAQDKDIAAELGVSMDEYFSMLRDTMGGKLFSFDGMLEDGQQIEAQSSHHGPVAEVEQGMFEQALAAAIDGLPERERLIISLYYDEELNLKEIGAILGVSESRVSQLHSQCAARLRSRLQDWLG